MRFFPAILALVTVATSAIPVAACAQAVEGHLRAPEKVTEKVHVMRQPNRLWSAVVGNVTIIEQSDGIVLVDSGGTTAEGKRVVAQVRLMTNKPVKAVAISHWHNDHTLGLPAILSAWPKTRVIATPATQRGMMQEMAKNVGLQKSDHQLDLARLQRSELRAQEYDQSARDPKLSESERREYAVEARYLRKRAQEAMGSHIILPTETFTNRLIIDDAIAPVELMFVGKANTEGDIVAWLPRQRVLVTGDIVVAPTPYGFNSYPADWIEALGKLKATNFAFLIPGHGPVQIDTTYLDKLVATLSDVRRQVGPLAARGLSLEKVEATVDYSVQTKIFTGGDPWATTWFRNYWLEPITSSAYREAKGVPILPSGD